MSPFIFARLKEDIDNCFVYEIWFDGVNFPANGPVMQRKTVEWEPSTEKMLAVSARWSVKGWY